jgi:tetratricopeptide (TPR) repeat protein
MGLQDEGQEYLKKELAINPHDFDSNLFRGVHLYKNEQKYEEALEHFEHALQVRPDALEVSFQIGLVYLLQNRVEEALEIIEKVVEQSPDFLEGHISLTRLYYRLKRTEEAERHRKIVEELRAKKESEPIKKMPTESPPPPK